MSAYQLKSNPTHPHIFAEQVPGERKEYTVKKGETHLACGYQVQHHNHQNIRLKNHTNAAVNPGDWLIRDEPEGEVVQVLSSSVFSNLYEPVVVEPSTKTKAGDHPVTE